MPQDPTKADIEKALKKLKRPPQPHNLVRGIREGVMETAKEQAKLALNFPRHTYLPGSRITKDVMILGLDRTSAIRAAQRSKPVLSRAINEEYVASFCDESHDLGLLGRTTFEVPCLRYRVSSQVSVPIRPTTAILEGGRFRVIMQTGWATMPLTLFNRRLMFSVLEDGLFSLEDFRDAHGEFICFPRERAHIAGTRKAMVMRRGDYKLLSKADLKEVLDMYMKGLALAEVMLRDMTTTEPQPDKRDEQHPSLFDTLPIFDQPK